MIYYDILWYIIIYYFIFLFIIIYYYILLYFIIYYYILFYIFIYYYILLYIIIFYFILFYIIIYYFILLYIIIYYYILLYACVNAVRVFVCVKHVLVDVSVSDSLTVAMIGKAGRTLHLEGWKALPISPMNVYRSPGLDWAVCLQQGSNQCCLRLTDHPGQLLTEEASCKFHSPGAVVVLSPNRT